MKLLDPKLFILSLGLPVAVAVVLTGCERPRPGAEPTTPAESAEPAAPSGGVGGGPLSDTERESVGEEIREEAKDVGESAEDVGERASERTEEGLEELHEDTEQLKEKAEDAAEDRESDRPLRDDY